MNRPWPSLGLVFDNDIHIIAQPVGNSVENRFKVIAELIHFFYCITMEHGGGNRHLAFVGGNDSQYVLLYNHL